MSSWTFLCGSASVRALWMTFFLNSTFTGAQIAGSVIANSVALGADSGTMVVDSVTYLFNIAAECVRLRGASERTCAMIDASASGLSVIALIVVSALAIQDAISRILSNSGAGGGGASDPGNAVNAQVMFAFTLGNLIIDIGMLGSILLRKRGGWVGVLTCRTCKKQQSVVNAAGPDASGGIDAQLIGAADFGGEGEAAGEHGGTAAHGEELNIFSALSHVMADTMRTVTEMTCSLLIWADQSINGEMADAYSALIVSATILAIAAFILYETVTLVRQGVLARAAVATTTTHGTVDPLAIASTGGAA